MTPTERRRARKANVEAAKAAGIYVPRKAHESRGTTSCPRSTTPKEMVRRYEHHEFDVTVKRYCSVDHVADPNIGHGT